MIELSYIDYGVYFKRILELSRVGEIEFKIKNGVVSVGDIRVCNFEGVHLTKDDFIDILEVAEEMYYRGKFKKQLGW